jgi:hypothetical protein
VAEDCGNSDGSIVQHKMQAYMQIA